MSRGDSRGAELERWGVVEGKRYDPIRENLQLKKDRQFWTIGV